MLLLVASCRDRGAAPEPRFVPPSYADRQASPANPTGLYWEGERLWAWSNDHSVQHSYEHGPQGWQPGPLREGPSGTERCLVGRAELQGSTFCVGRYQSAGVVVFDGSSNTARAFGALPARAGFRDIVLMHQLGLVGVLDAATDRLWWLDRHGAIVAQQALGASSYRVGWAGEDRVFVLAGSEPQLRVLRVSGDGTVVVLAHWERAAPLRDAVYDDANGLLWAAGPEDRAVRRAAGPIEHLGAELLGLDGAALARGELHVAAKFELEAHGVADPTRLESVAGLLVVSLTGSDRLAWVSREGERWELRLTTTGLGPAGLAGTAGLLAVAARLDDRVYVYDLHATVTQVIVVDGRPRVTPRSLGERLFYGALLWSQSRERPFSCNSCHWDAESDRRKHPGFLETRYEQTRPLGGVGAFAPIFTPGQAHTLADAVEGFVRILDDRYWRNRAFEEEPIELRVKGGELRRIAPAEKRRALREFLAALPVSPGPYLRSELPEMRTSLERGAQLFLDDCADCHVPKDERGRVAGGPAALLDALRRRPLLLGATGFAESGPGPSFTPHGNRISPLMGLSRGGPYFSSGGASTLRDVVEGFTRDRPAVHAGTGHGAYRPEQIDALEAFLLAL